MSVFDKIQIKKPKYSTFDLSHEKKLSFKMGKLVPTFLSEVVPGDRFRVNSEIMLRLAPLLAPIMHRVNVYTHYFFVPNRILWDEWEDFITGGEDGTLTPEHPYYQVGNSADKGSLVDYFGLPIRSGTASTGYQASALPFRAYQLIFNEYYRDQNLDTEIPIDKSSGRMYDSDPMFQLRDRAWEKDYFTSALPWAQRGDSVSVDITSSGDSPAKLARTDGGDFNADNVRNLAMNVDPDLKQAALRDDSQAGDLYISDFGDAGININDLRRASRLQQWLERTARGGSRYIEQILAHFGVRSSDSRLQRPEYLAGGRQPITLSEVLSTANAAEAGENIGFTGDIYGHGISVGNTNSFNRRFEEHGFIMGITSVLPRTAYQQGIHKSFLRFDKFDYYFPEFANLGEEEIINEELYHDFGADTAAENKGVFGYTPRYSSYKYLNSTVHGDFRDNLEYWHMGRKFANRPALNADFVKSDPTTRIFTVEDGTDQLWCQIFHNVKATRPMPYFGTPRL